jgi:hypothetical protein
MIITAGPRRKVLQVYNIKDKKTTTYQNYTNVGIVSISRSADDKNILYTLNESMIITKWNMVNNFSYKNYGTDYKKGNNVTKIQIIPVKNGKMILIIETRVFTSTYTYITLLLLFNNKCK